MNSVTPPDMPPSPVVLKPDSKGFYFCHYSLCKRATKGFRNPHDCKRHLEDVHNPEARKRCCPYPDSGCKIQAGETHQLSNWYEHIVIVHKKYVYSCDDCEIEFTHRKGAYAHYKTTGHQCLPSQWDDARKEHELAIKNECYRLARAELMEEKNSSGKTAWDDAWEETLPEYSNFMRKKERNIGSSVPSHQTPAALPSLPSMVDSSPPRPKSPSVCVSRSTKSKTRSNRFEPYGRLRPHQSLERYTPPQLESEHSVVATMDFRPRSSVSFYSRNIDLPSSSCPGFSDVTTRTSDGIDSFLSNSMSNSAPLLSDEQNFQDSSLRQSHGFDTANLRPMSAYGRNETWNANSLSSYSELSSCIPDLASPISAGYSTPSISLNTVSALSPLLGHVFTPLDSPFDDFSFGSLGCVNSLEAIVPRFLHPSPGFPSCTSGQDEYSS